MTNNPPRWGRVIFLFFFARSFVMLKHMKDVIIVVNFWMLHPKLRNRTLQEDVRDVMSQGQKGDQMIHDPLAAEFEEDEKMNKKASMFEKLAYNAQNIKLQMVPSPEPIQGIDDEIKARMDRYQAADRYVDELEENTPELGMPARHGLFGTFAGGLAGAGLGYGAFRGASRLINRGAYNAAKAANDTKRLSNLNQDAHEFGLGIGALGGMTGALTGGVLGHMHGVSRHNELYPGALDAIDAAQEQRLFADDDLMNIARLDPAAYRRARIMGGYRNVGDYDEMAEREAFRAQDDMELESYRRRLIAEQQIKNLAALKQSGTV